jgi:CRISPR-associated protein Csy2
MTAFIGLMWALERKLSGTQSIIFNAVGVVCHGFEPEVTEHGYTRAFRLSRNPLNDKGETAAIVEEGRAHMELTLIFGINGAVLNKSQEERGMIAREIANHVASMRIAGGSVIPLPNAHRSQAPELIPLDADAEKCIDQFRRLRRRWLPGFTLVSRDDLLRKKLAELQAVEPATTNIDAWLDLSRLNFRAVKFKEDIETRGEEFDKLEWQHSQSDGWIVPIPVGYGALSNLHPAGSVINARDATTPFRFVESLYSVGQWIGPHHLNNVHQMLWYAQSDPDAGLYRCSNDFIKDAH